MAATFASILGANAVLEFAFLNFEGVASRPSSMMLVIAEQTRVLGILLGESFVARAEDVSGKEELGLIAIAHAAWTGFGCIT